MKRRQLAIRFARSVRRSASRRKRLARKQPQPAMHAVSSVMSSAQSARSAVIVRNPIMSFPPLKHPPLPLHLCSATSSLMKRARTKSIIQLSAVIQ